MLVNDSLNFTDKPQFKTSFIPTNLSKPSSVKCSFISIKPDIDCLNKRGALLLCEAKAQLIYELLKDIIAKPKMI